MGSEPTIFLLACLVSLGLTALIREIAPRFGLTDDPDGHRKLHGRATPVGGGIAVYLTTAVILGTLWLAPSETFVSSSDGDIVTAMASGEGETSTSASTPSAGQIDKATAVEETSEESPYLAGSTKDLHSQLRHGYKQLPALLLAGLVIVLVGLVDDRRGLKGKHKLLGQALAASILIYGGLVIERIEFLNYRISLGYVAYPFTLCWLLGAINALNLLDGIDGLATVLGIILSFTIAAMAVVMGNQGVAIIAMVFIGSLLGFLRFNFPPASIFLGDSGSMLIGLVVGALAIGGSLKGAGTVLLAAPVAICMIPFFDSFAAIVRRKLTGRSIYDTDRGHLHHRLMNVLGSNRKVLGWVTACCEVIAVALLVGLVRQDDFVVTLTCFGIVTIFIATGIFGRVELLLVGTRLRGIGRTLVSPIFAGRHAAWQTRVRLQGNQQWDILWATFVEAADKFELTKIRLDVNMPTMHEAYHASWERPARQSGGARWQVEVPLVLNRRSIGLIRVIGNCSQPSACVDIQHIIELIEPFESRLRDFALDATSAIPRNADADTGHLQADSLSTPTTPR